MNRDDPLVVAWKNGQIPIINGVTFRNGKCIRMKLYSEDPNTYVGNAIRKIDEEDTDVIGAPGGFEFTHYCPYFRISVPGRDIEIVGGDGAMGGDGFIAAVESSSDEPLWVFFCDDSNPFDHAELEKDIIRAHSTLDRIWCINMNDPTQIRILDM